jgi:hypothetical protein
MPLTALPEGANPDEVLLAVISVAGLVAAIWALAVRVDDALQARTLRGRIVAWGRARSHGLIALMHTGFLTQSVRLTQVRPADIPDSTLASVYVLPALSLLALLATVNDLLIRYRLRRHDPP